MHFHQPYRRAPVSSHPCRYLLLSFVVVLFLVSVTSTSFNHQVYKRSPSFKHHTWEALSSWFAFPSCFPSSYICHCSSLFSRGVLAFATPSPLTPRLHVPQLPSPVAGSLSVLGLRLELYLLLSLVFTLSIKVQVISTFENVQHWMLLPFPGMD